MELEKFIYDKIYDELNRCRDWPLKILGFTSGLYVAILAFLKTFSANVHLTGCEKSILIVLLSIFCGWCVIIIGKQHLEYLRYRNIQIRLQRKMKVDDWLIDSSRVIPENWDKELPVRLLTKCQGWLFYAFYIICLSVFTIFIIVNL